jgi:hypothetical protein
MKPTDLPVHTVRDHPVVLDSDLAKIYGVETKVFNQAFKRNAKRFPSEFVFQLTDDEWLALRSQIVTSSASPKSTKRSWSTTTRFGTSTRNCFRSYNRRKNNPNAASAFIPPMTHDPTFIHRILSRT